MSKNLNNIELYVTFTSGSLEICKDVSEIILDKMSHIEEFTFNTATHQSTVGDHQFYSGIMTLSIPEDMLLGSLNQLDHIKSGYASPMIPSKCNDITAVVNFDNYHGTEVSNSTFHYLLNKTQEQDKKLMELEDQINDLQSMAGRYEAKFEYYDTKYASMQAYIHTYIDLNRLAEVVRDLAEVVDPDILESIQKVTVH